MPELSRAIYDFLSHASGAFTSSISGFGSVGSASIFDTCVSRRVDCVTKIKVNTMPGVYFLYLFSVCFGYLQSTETGDKVNAPFIERFLI